MFLRHFFAFLSRFGGGGLHPKSGHAYGFRIFWIRNEKIKSKNRSWSGSLTLLTMASRVSFFDATEVVIARGVKFPSDLTEHISSFLSTISSTSESSSFKSYKALFYFLVSSCLKPHVYHLYCFHLDSWSMCWNWSHGQLKIFLIARTGPAVRRRYTKFPKLVPWCGGFMKFGRCVACMIKRIWSGENNLHHPPPLQTSIIEINTWIKVRRWIWVLNRR